MLQMNVVFLATVAEGVGGTLNGSYRERDSFTDSDISDPIKQ